MSGALPPCSRARRPPGSPGSPSPGRAGGRSRSSPRRRAESASGGGRPRRTRAARGCWRALDEDLAGSGVRERPGTHREGTPHHAVVPGLLLAEAGEDPGACCSSVRPSAELVEVRADLLETVAREIRLALDQAVLNPSTAHHGDQKDPLHPRAHEAHGTQDLLFRRGNHDDARLAGQVRQQAADLPHQLVRRAVPFARRAVQLVHLATGEVCRDRRWSM